MREAAERFERILRKISDTMDNDTLLFVFGDHGSSEWGKHGGDSKGEMNTNFFVHSKGNKKFKLP